MPGPMPAPQCESCGRLAGPLENWVFNLAGNETSLCIRCTRWVARTMGTIVSVKTRDPMMLGVHGAPPRNEMLQGWGVPERERFVR